MSDFVARFGGDEFVVILPDTPEEGARRITERLQENLRKASWPHRHVTVAIGIATLLPSESSGFEMLLARADQALYACKRER